jgi:hypothetical protein
MSDADTINRSGCEIDRISAGCLVDSGVVQETLEFIIGPIKQRLQVQKA